MQRKMGSSLCVILCIVLLLGTQQTVSFRTSTVSEELLSNDSLVSSVESWLPGWKYRKAHNITGVTGAGEDYPERYIPVFRRRDFHRGHVP